MKIISGIYKNQKLKYPSTIRPSTAKHKKMVFDTIRQNIPSANVLDMFSGSGQMGLEALSLGASHVDFIDSGPKCIQIIKNNIESIDIETDKTNVFLIDAENYIKNSEKKYDIIICDPPYHQIVWNKLKDLNKLAHDNTVLVVKYSPHNPPIDFFGWELIKQKDQKDTIINFYLSS